MTKSKKTDVKVDVETGEVQLDIPFVDSPPLIRRQLARPHLAVAFEGVSRTEQSHKDSVCINRIMQSVSRTGVLPVVTKVPNYGDVSHLNRPYSDLLTEARITNDKLVKFSAEQKEKIRLAKIERQKKDAEDAKKYRESLATATTSTEPQK